MGARLFMGPVWTLLSPTSLLLGQDGCLEAVKGTEGTERVLIHKQPHSTEVRTGPLGSQGPLMSCVTGPK